MFLLRLHRPFYGPPSTRAHWVQVLWFKPMPARRAEPAVPGVALTTSEIGHDSRRHTYYHRGHDGDVTTHARDRPAPRLPGGGARRGHPPHQGHRADPA